MACKSYIVEVFICGKRKKEEMNYSKEKRERIDKCNICLQTKQLTWDHVPPQGCLNSHNIEIFSFFEKLAGRGEERKISFSQNGLKYRTICGECNSFLGSKYDDELNKLVKTLLQFVNSKLIIPPTIRLRVKPLPIIKSVVGHILAAKKQLDDVKYDNVFRQFVLDENVKVPDKLHLFYWIYPYENTIVMRDFIMPAERQGDFNKIAFSQLLKFFPLAFLLTEVDTYQGLPSLTTLTTLSKALTMETEVDIPIYFNRTHPPFWPEMVDDNNIMLTSRETSNAVFVKNKKIKR